MGHNRTQGSKVNRSSECSLEGSDKIDLSGIFIEETGHISSTLNDPKTCTLDGETDDESSRQENLDQFVNTKIICPHGNLNSTNRRLVRYVPSSMWDKLK